MRIPTGLINRAVFARVAELILRGGALFLGLYTLCSLALMGLGPTAYDANIWWIDLRALPSPLRVLLMCVFAAALIHRAAWPVSTRMIRTGRTVMLMLLALILIGNSVSAWGLHIERVMQPGQSAHGVRMGMPIPLTAVLAVGVVGLSCSRRLSPEQAETQRTSGAKRGHRVWRGVGVLAVAGLFALVGALAQMFAFGESDYRRPAEVILVYGCQAYPDGRPSQALADRVYTACELYHQGLAPVIVMSGGPVDDTMHEARAMADYAVRLGVPREAIVLDRSGLDTQATATNLNRLLGVSDQQHSLRVLAVSHDYHLPRVKMSLERAGVRAYTVPCEVRRGMPGRPYFMARETAALWYYYLTPARVAMRL